MKETESLIKVGNVVLTPEAISFLEYMQEESNSSLKGYRQRLLEGINSANLLLNYPAAFPSEQIEKARENLTELSMLYYDLEKLAKP